MRRTKANRALTFVMAAALLIGSIHGVGAKEQSKAYDAPELTLLQGESDYDLTEGITYDSEKYTLSVTDTGNFDVNVAGDYEISYALTEKESSVNVTESVENTESADSVESIENIESTETVSGTETIETTDAMATVEDTDQTPEGDATNTVDTQEKQVITFTRTVHVAAASEDEVPMYEARELVLVQGEEGYDLTDEILYDDVKYTLTVGDLGGFDINKIGSYAVTYSLTPVTTEGTQENGQDDTQENQVITFQRTVTVKAAEEENALYEAPDLYTVTKAASNGYSLNLGTAIWDADSHTTFKYPHAKIENTADKVTLLTVTVENGSFDKPADAENPNLTDLLGKSKTWIFNAGKSVDEVQTLIRNIAFTPQTGSNMNVNITIDGNKTTGFDSLIADSKITQWTLLSCDSRILNMARGLQ